MLGLSPLPLLGLPCSQGLEQPPHCPRTTFCGHGASVSCKRFPSFAVVQGHHHPKNPTARSRALLPLSSARFCIVYPSNGEPRSHLLPFPATTCCPFPRRRCHSVPGTGHHCSCWGPGTLPCPARGVQTRGCRPPVCPRRQIRVAQATGMEKTRLDRGAQGCLFSVLSA